MTPIRRFLLVMFGAACLLPAQKYSGPIPAKADMPYLLHAENLIATEAAEAREESGKNDTIYTIAGASSPVRTPLAGPIFILKSESLAPNTIELYRLESRNGRREISFSRKKKQGARPLRLMVTRLTDTLYRLEAHESLENGEYSLTPSGSNQVFCFQVY